MYQTFFGLHGNPFRMTPDPSVICLTPRHREALAGLGYAILNHKGFTVLTGDAGTGKTTLISRIVQTIPREKVSFSVVLNSVLTPSEFLESALIDFGLNNIRESKAQRVLGLQRFLLNAYGEGRHCVLIVDEAQNLSPEVLEEVRLLSNCELPDRKLLQIVLCGQPELESLLEREELRQLKQRVEVRLRIAPLTATEVEEYVRFRWRAAGGCESTPFAETAIVAVIEYSRGIPRLINVLCDNALLAAFAEEKPTVGREHVDEAARDLAMAPRPAAGAIPPPARRREPAPPALQEAASSVQPGLATLARYEKPALETRSRVSRWAARLGLAKAG